MPDLRTEQPRDDAAGLVLLAYDARTQKIVIVTVGAVLASLADDMPLAGDDGVILSTDGGRVLSGDIRDE